MSSATKFVRSRDGTRIAYAVAGDGPPLVLLNAEVCSHVELFPLQPGVEGYLERLGRNRTLVRMDFRGAGMSDRETSDHSPDAYTDDLEAVIDDLGISSFDIVSISNPGPTLRLAVRRPGCVRRIALASPFHPRPINPGHPAEPGMLGLMESDWQTFLELTNQRWSSRPISEIGPILSFVRRCVDQANFVAYIKAREPEEDWRLAASIAVPVLVMDLGHTAWPAGRIKAFSEQFPRASYMALPDGTHSPPYGDPELLLQALEEFFGPIGESALCPPEITMGVLTPREREVLALLAAGRTQPEIATGLCISPTTVSKHVVSVYGKIGVHRRAEAVAWAIYHGLGAPPGRSLR